MKRLAAFLLVAALFVSGLCAATPRNSRQVKRQRTATEQKIARTRSQLNRNAEETRRELLNLQSIEADIARRDKQIERLKAKVADLNARERRLNDTIRRNEDTAQKLRVSYGKAVRAAHRQRSLASKAAFIFSASSFEQARSRMRYLEELRKWQHEKSAALKTLNETLSRQKLSLDSLRRHTAASIDSVEREQTALVESRNRADDIVSSLKRQKRNLDKVLQEQIEQSKKLDQELSRLIEEEARAEREAQARAEHEAMQRAQMEERKKKLEAEAAEQAKDSDKKKKKPGKKKDEDKKKDKKKDEGRKKKETRPNEERPAIDDRQPDVPKTAIASTTQLTAPFAQCKGKLPSPVDRSANIVSSFGRHAHSNLSKVQVQNNGVDFETTPGASACAVYPGVVSMIINMDGYENVVMLRHGKYVTVYAGIGKLDVRKGQHVKAGQPLGTIWSDRSDGNRTRLHFEIRHEKVKLDPAAWLK